MRTQLIRRTIARTRLISPALIALVAAASCRGGCRHAAEPGATAAGRLALFPAAARVVVSIDVARLRASPAAEKLAAAAQQSPADARQIEAFARRTGFDPLRQLDSVTLAFPEEARRNGELGLVLRADGLDEARLVAYVRDELQKTGDDLVATAHGRYTLWSARRDPTVAGFFADGHTFVLGAGGWGARMADLAETARAGDSAATNADLVRLVDVAAGGHAMWGVAIVPEATRQTLAADPNFTDAAAINALTVTIDIDRGLDAILRADVATVLQAQSLAAKVTASIHDAKRNATVLMLGLGPHLDGVGARAVGHTFELHAGLSELALDDVIARLGALVALARGGELPGLAPPPAAR